MNLSAQLDHLDRLLLSGVQVQFPDELPDEEKAMINAYVVLSHAVIEEFIEDLFEGHFRRLSGWLVSPMVPAETVRLALAIADWLPEKQMPTYKKRTLEGMFKAAKSALVIQLRNNHGIKDHNISQMASLVGVDWRSMDAALNAKLADLTTLGSKRGEAGHLSPYTERAKAITRQTYPDDVREWVENARKACVAMEEYLDNLVLGQQPMSIIGDWDGN
ncbi:HEPN domain-containing protein [Promicromonospora sp. MS192]|uniref:HEPN domain-containing protein n=1 Tax=Promicromonospora sp. MS192 TaxID=3412684 RepID=UPI003C3043D8